MVNTTRHKQSQTGTITAFIGMGLACLMISFLLLALDSRTARAAEQGVTLKPKTFVSDTVITVGDVFTNAGRYTNHVLAPAPQPGESMVLGVYDLTRISNAFSLDWAPATRHDKVVLQRAVREVEKSEVARLIEETVAKKVAADNIEIDIVTVLPRMLVNGTKSPVLTAENVSINPMDDTFEVALKIQGETGPADHIDIAGRVHRMIDVPVLSSSLRNGDIIRDYNVKPITIRDDDLNQDYALQTADLVGMTPRRSLTSDRPVRISDLEKPKLVEKGDAITMVLKQGPLSLTAKGKAMDSGAKGDTIRVMNTSSRRMVEARVNGPQQVVVAVN